MANPPIADVNASATSTTKLSRTILPRRGLPNGRAVVGGLLVAVAAVGSFAIATTGEEGPGTEYLVLVNDVEPGEAIGLGDVSLAAMTLSPEAEANALRSTVGLEGATALDFLRAGAILDVRSLNGAAYIDGVPVTDVHELTVPVPRDRAPANLRRGDRVTILAFDEQSAVVRTALEDALVLAYDTEARGIGSSEEGRLTLGLSAADLVLDATLLSYQELTIVLTSRALSDEYDTVRAIAAIEPAATEVVEVIQ